MIFFVLEKDISGTGGERCFPPMNAPFLTDEERERHRREKLL